MTKRISTFKYDIDVIAKDKKYLMIKSFQKNSRNIRSNLSNPIIYTNFAYYIKVLYVILRKLYKAVMSRTFIYNCTFHVPTT